MLEGLPYVLVKAHPAHDAFSLGITLYNLCAKFQFFNTNNEDNIESTDLLKLFTFDGDFVNSMVSKVKDKIARNLISQLLVKDPHKRANMSQVLAHPFITGRKAARMIGQAAEFDVFISYRVASDSAHAELVYNLLTEAGLKVWWDKKCLVRNFIVLRIV